MSATLRTNLRNALNKLGVNSKDFKENKNKIDPDLIRSELSLVESLLSKGDSVITMINVDSDNATVVSLNDSVNTIEFNYDQESKSYKRNTKRVVSKKRKKAESNNNLVDSEQKLDSDQKLESVN